MVLHLNQDVEIHKSKSSFGFLPLRRAEKDPKHLHTITRRPSHAIISLAGFHISLYLLEQSINYLCMGREFKEMDVFIKGIDLIWS